MGFDCEPDIWKRQVESACVSGPKLHLVLQHRRRQPRHRKHPLQQAFEVRVRQFPRSAGVVEQSFQDGRTCRTGAPQPLERFDDPSSARSTTECVVEGLFDLGGIDHGAQLYQRPGNRGCADALNGSDVRFVIARPAMAGRTRDLTMTMPLEGDFDDAWREAIETVKRRRRPVRDDRSSCRRYAQALAPRRRSAGHRENIGQRAIEATSCDGSPELLRIDAAATGVCSRDNTMLRRCSLQQLVPGRAHHDRVAGWLPSGVPPPCST